MKNLSERLKHALKLTKVSQSELARRIGIKQQSISQICSGRSTRSRYTMQIAEALEVNAHWLATGEGDIGLGASSQEFKSGAQGQQIPLINWVQAANWAELRVKGLTDDDVEEWRAVAGETNENYFALRVKGDSMECQGGRSVPEGAVIIVDSTPCTAYSSGVLVVACLEGSSEATFKQLVIDGEQKFLKPLNPQYPAIPIDCRCAIIGIVRQAIIDFL